MNEALGALADATLLGLPVVEVLAGTNRAFLVLAALLVGVGMLELPERWNQRVGQLWFIALALQAGLWFTRAIGFGLRRYEQRHSSASMTQVSASATLMSWSLRTVLWAALRLPLRCRTSWATCSPRCPSPSTSRSRWAMQSASAVSWARRSTSASRPRGCAA